MGKLPAFQFYPNDWSRDLEEHPLEIEGAWIRICCKLFWAEERGQATKTLREWSRILRVPILKTRKIIFYLFDKKIAQNLKKDSISLQKTEAVLLNQILKLNPDEGIYIASKRMVNDEHLRIIRTEAGLKGGNPKLIKQNQNKDDLLNQNDNQKQTPSSSSSSSTSNTDIKTYSDEVLNLSDLLFNQIKKNNPQSKLHACSNGDKEKKINSWAKDIDLLVRVDNQTYENIEKVIFWATSDLKFWAKNILSGKKLREKWDTLSLEANKPQQPKGNEHGRTDDTFRLDGEF